MKWSGSTVEARTQAPKLEQGSGERRQEAPETSIRDRAERRKGSLQPGENQGDCGPTPRTGTSGAKPGDKKAAPSPGTSRGKRRTALDCIIRHRTTRNNQQYKYRRGQAPAVVQLEGGRRTASPKIGAYGKRRQAAPGWDVQK